MYTLTPDQIVLVSAGFWEPTTAVSMQALDYLTRGVMLLASIGILVMVISNVI